MSARHRPHPALEPHVSSFVGYHHVLRPEAVHHGMPSPGATVILALDEPLDVGWLASDAGRARFWTLAGGLHLAPALIRTHGFQHGIQLDLTPLGVRAILGVPPAALAHTMVTHEELPLGLTSAVVDAVSRASSWPERFDLLERHLLSLLARHESDPVHQVRPEAVEAWRVLERTHGRVRVAHLADHLGWSRRHLTGRFTDEYGVSPKQAARLFRFDRARMLLEAGRPLGETAYDMGYADQAHLAREFRALAGRTPTETIREPFTFVQETADRTVARSVA